MLFEKTVKNKFKSTLLVRHDPDGSVLYFEPTELGLYAEGFDFKGNRGQRLAGYFYTGEVTHPERLIIFEHGMGCGHKAYAKEIYEICRAGYTVFAYDHTGTLASEGESIGGFSQSLADLDFAISALRAAGRLDGKRISVIGHSWGGFSAMNIPALHPDIESVVELSGFVSVREMLLSVLGPMKGYADMLLESEAEVFGHYSYADGRYSLGAAKTRALIVYSKDDPTCPFSHFEKLKAALSGRENVSFMELDGKRHNPNFTVDAVTYKDNFFAELTRARKKKKLDTKEARAEFVSRYDFERMTAQDGEFWAKIFDFIENK